MNDETDCRDIAAFQGQNCRCALFSQLTAVFGEFVRGSLGFAAGLIAVSGMVAMALLFCDILSRFFSLYITAPSASQSKPRRIHGFTGSLLVNRENGDKPHRFALGNEQ